jgi:gamma-glutamyltranspeptidase/glutathione hydrolase
MRHSTRFAGFVLLAWMTVTACSEGPAETPAAVEAVDPFAALSAGPISDGLAAHRPAVTGTNGLITAGHPLAAMAGMRILMQGGTAADAAVAVLATLNQVEPMMSGAGGNGFMTIYDKASGEVHSLNATGAAPRALDAATVTADELARGMKAGAVPGLLGGWIAMLDRFGTMSLAEVLEPAIGYAEKGHPVAPFVARSIDGSRELFGRFETTADVFLKDGAPVAGEILTYPDLARTFRKLIEAEDTSRATGGSRTHGLRAAFDRFYKGDIARDMARFYERNGGLFTRDDFARYEPIWAEPVHTTYRGYDVYSSPATSRGGLEVTMQLNLIEGFDVAALGHNSAEALHLVAETIKIAKADIYHFVADPKTTDVPTAALLSRTFADTRRALIRSDAVMAYPDHGTPPGTQMTRHDPSAGVPSERSYPGSTTSFTVVDGDGNVIVCTPTLGSRWGTGVIVGDTGLFFNNGTRHGSTSPYPDDVNYTRGGQIPILNNSPTLVMKDGEFFLALGTPGGETIGQTQFQVLLNVLDHGMGIQQAIEAPRIALRADPNFYKPGALIVVDIEGRMAPRVVAELEALGHTVDVDREWSIGNMQGVLVSPEQGTMTAGADPRRMMYAVGW